jgi:esterase FrsA
MKRHTRSVSEVWDNWKDAAKLGVYPFDHTSYEDHDRVLTSLQSLDREEWAKAYNAAAKPFEQAGRAAERAGDLSAAQKHYLHASGLYRMGRWPACNSPGKNAAYEKSKEMFLAAAKHFVVPVERVEMPFNGRPGDGKVVIGHFRKPHLPGTLPVLLAWGGLDYYKEDAADLFAPLLDKGAAILTIDIPGTADAPVLASVDAERMWNAAFAWIKTREDLDADRVVGWGLSTGGYWAAKVAHTHAEYFAGVVNHGGCAHFTFQPEWIEKAQFGTYPFELAETLASTMGLDTFEDWIANAPKLSLLEQGWLDRPSAPLLLINGTADTVFSPDDMQLLLQHGRPKTARFYLGDHMGITPDTFPTIYAWIAERLGIG